MLNFKVGDRVEVLSRPDVSYSWTAACGQRGVIVKVENTHGQMWVQFDNFRAATGGWFSAEEIGHLNALDRIVEST
jgi:hypothetical protein